MRPGQKSKRLIEVSVATKARRISMIKLFLLWLRGEMKTLSISGSILQMLIPRRKQRVRDIARRPRQSAITELNAS